MSRVWRAVIYCWGAPASGGLFPTYEVVGIDDSDKIQMDLASNCSSQFNKVLRPGIEVDELNGKTVVVVFIPEDDDSSKPIYFKHQGEYDKVALILSLPKKYFYNKGTKFLL